MEFPWSKRDYCFGLFCLVWPELFSPKRFVLSSFCFSGWMDCPRFLARGFVLAGRLAVGRGERALQGVRACEGGVTIDKADVYKISWLKYKFIADKAAKNPRFAKSHAPKFVAMKVKMDSVPKGWLSYCQTALHTSLENILAHIISLCDACAEANGSKSGGPATLVDEIDASWKGLKGEQFHTLPCQANVGLGLRFVVVWVRSLDVVCQAGVVEQRTCWQCLHVRLLRACALDHYRRVAEENSR